MFWRNSRNNKKNWSRFSLRPFVQVDIQPSNTAAAAAAEIDNKSENNEGLNSQNRILGPLTRPLANQLVQTKLSSICDKSPE